MGSFLNNEDLQPKDIVNNYVSSYLTSTERYSKFQADAPNFVTYYSKDFEKSTSDISLDNTEEIIGSNSSLRYNKLKDFPLYSVGQINPNIEWDEETGLDSSLETEALVLPGTIEPLPNDFVVFQYQTNDNQNSRIYQVENVEFTSHESSAYYKITLKNFNVNVTDIESQVSNTYRTIYANIGTDKKSLILEEDYYETRNNISSVQKLSNILINEFYDKNLNLFVYYDEEFSGIALKKYIDLNLAKFVFENNLLVESNTYLKNIVPYTDRNPNNERENNKKYKNSIYYKLMNKDKKLPNLIKTEISKDSFLSMFSEKYIQIDYLRTSNEVNLEKSLELFDGTFTELPNISKINRINEDYQGPKSLAFLEDKYRIINLYLNDDKIKNDFIKHVVKKYEDTEVYTLEDYILIPILIYILKDNMEKVFKK